MNFDCLKIWWIISKWTFHIILKTDDNSHFVSSERMTKKQKKDQMKVKDEMKIQNFTTKI